MKKIITSAVVAMTILLSGCATQVYTLQGGEEPIPAANVRQHFLISGLGQTKYLNAARVCNGAENVARIESTLSAVDGVLNWITFGIYTPKHAKVYCVINP